MRPRRPFGINRPGQLPATRVKILAAELSDPQRLSRARQYAGDGSVLDITVEPRVVTATVLGSRPDPYLVELHVDDGFGPPSRGEVSSQCSCPDTEGTWAPDGGWCKHALAALLVLADEIAIDPDVLHRWRGAVAEGSPARRSSVSTGTRSAAAVVPITRDTLAVVAAPAGPHPLDALLEMPDGVSMPLILDIEPVSPTPLADAELDKWVTDALAILTRRT